MVLFDNVRRVCKEKKVTFNSLERRAGIAKGSISKWRYISPSAIKLKRVADLLETTVDELMRE